MAYLMLHDSVRHARSIGLDVDPGYGHVCNSDMGVATKIRVPLQEDCMGSVALL